MLDRIINDFKDIAYLMSRGNTDIISSPEFTIELSEDDYNNIQKELKEFFKTKWMIPIEGESTITIQEIKNVHFPPNVKLKFVNRDKNLKPSTEHY